MTVDAVLLGAGNRGRFTYGAWARKHPDELQITALAEPDPQRRAACQREHGIPDERVFADWRELAAGPQLASSMIIATSDTMHAEPAIRALESGYDVLLEKPIAPTPEECVAVVAAAERTGCLLQIGHVLRYTGFYEKVHELVASGVLGDLVTIDMKEHVAYWHMTHSFVRGKFRNREIAAPLVLAKTCHDLDLMVWLAGSAPQRVASLGSLQHFQPAGAPDGAPARCTDGCPVQAECPHDAERLYLGPSDEIARLWPWSDVSPDPSEQARRAALETGRYGRCVYHCDNDVVDHQVLAVEFDGGVTATFTVQGLASEERRTIRLTGTRGELRGVLHDGLIEVSRHGQFGTEQHPVEPGSGLVGHFGGDERLVEHFAAAASGKGAESVRTSGQTSLSGHLLGFAAERARETLRVVELADFRREVGAEPA
ncbi:MAG: Gfo/Idh/MocA family protein [Myxococcota bacterium]